MLFLVVAFYSSTARCGPVLLLLLVKLYCSLWWPFATLCGRILLFLVILLLVAKLYYSLWSHFTIPCGHTLLLVVVFCYYLWLRSVAPCGHVPFVFICLSSLWLHIGCYFCDKIMDYDGEIIFPIEVALIVKLCASTSNLPSTAASHANNSTTTTCSTLWTLFANNQEYWKPKKLDNYSLGILCVVKISFTKGKCKFTCKS